MKVKICGIQQPKNLQQVAALKPDYMGFIFYPKSPRYVMSHLNASDFENIPESIKKIGVFVNEDPEVIMEYVEQFNLDGIQFHGDESPDTIYKFRNIGLVLFKAFGLQDDFDFDKLKEYEHAVDYFLLDTKTSQYGGSGQKFNWDILKNYSSSKPFLLSGGIGVEELEDVMSLQGMPIHAVDLNSKLEISPGLKDIDKVKQAIKIIYNGKI
jgi:phosphoribosylanthranilate isomerase